MTNANPDPALAALIDNIRALEERSAYRPCPELGVLYVRGDDRVTWLNGQLTNDIRDIAAGQSVHALAVNVRGKILAELYVADLGEAFVLVVPRRAEQELLASFERYIIMEDVSVEPAPALAVVYVHGPRAAQVAAPALTGFTCQPLGTAGRFYIGDSASTDALLAQLDRELPRIDDSAYEVVRLRRALPRYAVDYDEHNYPQEAGLKSLVSFSKGCYLGQEVVCTLENRGKLARHLCALAGPEHVADSAFARAAASGQRVALQLSQPSQPSRPSTDNAAADAAGSITSVVWDPERACYHVLGFVRRSYSAPGTSFFAGAQPLTLVRVVGDDSAPPASP